jgi:DNA modification methylase
MIENKIKNTSKSTEGAERARRRSGQHQGAQIITSNITGHWKHNPTTRWRVMTSPDTVRTLRRCAQLLLFYGDTVVSSRLLQYSILIVAHAAGRRPHIYEVVLSYCEVLLSSQNMSRLLHATDTVYEVGLCSKQMFVFSMRNGVLHTLRSPR